MRTKTGPDAGVGHTGSDRMPRRCTLDGFAEEVAVAEGINVREAEPLVPILVTTQLFNDKTTGPPSTSPVRGRYQDRWSKRNGRWAIDHRQYIFDFTCAFRT